MTDWCGDLRALPGTPAPGLPGRQLVRRPAPPARTHPTRHPTRRRVTRGQRAFAAAAIRPVLLTRGNGPEGRAAALAGGADVVRAGVDRVGLTAGLAALRAQGVVDLLCEGGPQLFGALVAEDLVDELCLTL